MRKTGNLRLTSDIITFTDLGNSCSIYSAGWEGNRASPTAFYDDVSTVSPASFTDGEPIIDVISNEEWDARANECIEDDTVSAYVDDGVENEEDMGVNDNIDKTAQNQNKVCLPRGF
jgi:hypothetical protein